MHMRCGCIWGVGAYGVWVHMGCGCIWGVGAYEVWGI